ncbi:hypothetical protein F4802DRAFT_542484 [Xylaria palmicola]|nr:hypothetical protein F4802DRAFT_542484 [Xylaria palmicola]
MASVPASEPAAPPTRHPHKTRKRASKACLSCRARKVRCDVSQRGRPCMNCYLDSETCVVTSRASKFRKIEQDGKEGAQVSHPPYHVDDDNHASTLDAGSSGVNRDSTSPQAEFVGPVDGPHAVDNVHATQVSAFGDSIQSETQQEHQSHMGFNFNRPLNATQTFNNASQVPLQSFNALGHQDNPFWVGEQPVTISADITYSYYPFLSINNLHNVMPHDVNFLESQGCLRIPTRAILDEFVQQYFLHVHPLLPFIDEGDFWHLYCNQGTGSKGERMSLLVFQAMLFSCCNFVSKTSIKALGFPNIRSARATLYRRTKLLFDFDTESSLVCLAQAALLLTYWAPNWSLATKKPNTAWLGVAIQNAKSAEAHMYSAMPTFSPLTDPVEYKKQNCLKRLWWCCVIRDRLISLGMRRSIQISRAHFDVDKSIGLGIPDLSGEVGLSKVYNPETKKRLIEIFVQLGELCCVLTDLLTLVFPLDDVPGWGRHNGAEGVEKVRECKAALRRWYKSATLRFPMFGGGGASGKTADKHPQHDSVILYTNLMYMFYHSARAALSHHEVLQAAMASASPGANCNLRGFSNIYESRNELQDAASGVTECLNELIQRRLARWLPISAISCTAMPLVLHIIDVKLSYQNKRRGATPDERRRTALKQQRLNVLIEAMKTYQPQYDGVDYISETIRHIVNLAQIDPPNNGPPGATAAASSMAALAQDYAAGDDDVRPVISDWTDILASHPGSYLRLSMTMDISISKGRLARETDFPVKLRGLFAHGFSPIRALLAGSHARALPTPPDFMPVASQGLPSPMAHHVPLGSVHSVSSDEDSASPDSMEGLLEGSNNEPMRQRRRQQQQQEVSEEGSISPPLLGGHLDDHADAHARADVAAAHMHADMFIDLDYADAYVALADLGPIGNGNDETGDDSGDLDMFDDEGGGKEVDSWIECAWGDDEGATIVVDGADDAGDKETARVLLDALRHDTMLCSG